jgi:hypothetical protein
MERRCTGSRLRLIENKATLRRTKKIGPAPKGGSLTCCENVHTLGYVLKLCLRLSPASSQQGRRLNIIRCRPLQSTALRRRIHLE